MPLRDLLGNLAVALRDIERLGLELEEPFVDAQTSLRALTDRSRFSVQALDLLLQRIADLARLSEALAAQISDDIGIDPACALQNLHLRDLAHVLEHGSDMKSPRPDGNVELF